MRILLRSANFINTFWNLLDIGVFPLVFLAFTPFFIGRLGAEEFGLWMLINSILASFQIMNFGLGPATQRNVARFRGRKDPAEIYRSINTNLSLAFLLLLLCLTCGVILFFAVRDFGLFHLQGLMRGKAAQLMLLAGFLVALKFFEQIFQHALKGYENFKAASQLNLALRFSILGFNIFLVFMHFDLYALIGTQVIITLAGLIFHALVLRKVIPGYRLFFHWEKEKIRDELRYGMRTWIQSVAVIATYQMDRFIVTGFFGLSVLSYYSIVATMFNHIHMILNALVPWMLPKVARLREKGAEVVSLFLSARAFVVLTGIFTLLIFYASSPYLFTHWLGAALYAEVAGYIKLFVLFEMFFVFTSAPYFFLNANGNEKLMTKITLLSSLITLACMFGGIVLFARIEGMIYGMIIGSIMGIIIENSLINREILKQSKFKESVLVLVPSILAIMLILGDHPVTRTLTFFALIFSAWVIFVRSGEFNLRLLLLG